jgi:hypothetical protein
MDPNRGLWSAVVLKARDDIAEEPIDSWEYREAVAFFTHDAAWRETRENVAAMIDLHPDDLRRGGECWIRQRRLKEGLPEVEVPAPPLTRVLAPLSRVLVRPVPAAKPVRQQLVVPPSLPPPRLVEIAPDTRKRRAIKSYGKTWEFNPFNPLLRARK